MLDKILKEARHFTHADAGSLYIKDGEMLKFMITQNDTLPRRRQGKPDIESFKMLTLPISNESLVGYAAMTGELVNIEDAYNPPDGAPYRINREFDEYNNYRTESILMVPMKDIYGNLVGVLQLINAMNEKKEVISFDENCETLIESLTSQA